MQKRRVGSNSTILLQQRITELSINQVPTMAARRVAFIDASGDLYIACVKV